MLAGPDDKIRVRRSGLFIGTIFAADARGIYFFRGSGFFSSAKKASHRRLSASEVAKMRLNAARQRQTPRQPLAPRIRCNWPEEIPVLLYL